MKVRPLFVGIAVALILACLAAVAQAQPMACICSGPAWWCAIYCGLI